MPSTDKPPVSRWQLWIAAFLPILLLTPFIDKAFHIDGPVYIYIAQHLQSHPINFYGFEINWGSWPSWVFSFNKNPPGLSYFLAIMAFGLGWSEIALHSAQLIPTVIASIGLFKLGMRFCKQPLLVCFVAVLTPSFLVSTSVIMCEPLMIMFYIWALVFWLKGLDDKSDKHLLLAGVCIGCSALTKYVGVTTIPLLMAYTMMYERKWVSRPFAFFLIPIIMLVVYDTIGRIQYDYSLLKGIVFYEAPANEMPFMQSLGTKLIHGLSFTGGSYITALFFMPLLHRWRMMGSMALVFVLAILIGVFSASIIREDLAYQEGIIQWGFILQLALFVTAGVYVFALAVEDFKRSRDADSLLLLLLVIGIFVFACVLNWTINARSLFPMVIAVAILVVRKLDTQVLDSKTVVKRSALPLLLGAIVSLSVGYADYTYAGTARDMAQRVHAEERAPEHEVWFQGHWGFQYYMEQGGATHMNWLIARGLDVPKPKTGDTIVWWVAQYDKPFPTYITMADIEEVEIPAASWVSIMGKSVGAGFYWSNQGPLPYRFGEAKPQLFKIFTVGENPYEQLEAHLEKVKPTQPPRAVAVE
jgi:hypothetical protein